MKSELYGVVKGKRKFDLSGERDEAVHGAQRRLVARAYTKDSMRALQTSVDVLIVNFMKKLEQFDGKSISLGYWLQLFAFGLCLQATRASVADSQTRCNWCCQLFSELRLRRGRERQRPLHAASELPKVNFLASACPLDHLHAQRDDASDW